MKSYRGLYSSLADAAHASREAARRDEQLDHLHMCIAEALKTARSLSREMHAEHYNSWEMGRVVANLSEVEGSIAAIRKIGIER